jgi:hypothetical protein
MNVSAVRMPVRFAASCPAESVLKARGHGEGHPGFRPGHLSPGFSRPLRPVLFQRKVEAMLNNSRRRLKAQALTLVLAAAAVAFAAPTRQARPPGQQNEPEGTAGWRTYNDKNYGFSVKYPWSFVILPERPRAAGDGPALVQRVRFQSKGAASGPLADMEPPQFAVEVFKREGAGTLRELVGAAGWVEEGDAVEPFELEGAKGGLRVRGMKMVAPNEFYYFATEDYLFRLTPLGEYGPAMLATFKLSATQ